MSNRITLVFALVTIGVGVSCRDRVQEGPQRDRVILVSEAPSEDEVVATVDQRPIRASEIAAVAAAEGVAPRQALDDLIIAEALVSEAARRGLDLHEDVLQARRTESVRRYLKTEFETTVRPEQIPPRELRRAYERNKTVLYHSEYVDTWHILVPAKDKDTAELRARAEALANQIRERALKVTSAEEFKAIATDIDAGEFAGKLKVEQIITARDGWVEPGFSQAAHDQLKKEGDVSRPARTSYGFHVIYLNRRIPENHVTFDEAIPMLQRGLLSEFQRFKFGPYLDALVAKHDVKTFPEHIPTEPQ